MLIVGINRMMRMAYFRKNPVHLEENSHQSETSSTRSSLLVSTLSLPADIKHRLLQLQHINLSSSPIPTFFASGTKNLKAQVLEAGTAAGAYLDSGLESLMQVFKPKEYLNRNLLTLEKTLDL